MKLPLLLALTALTTTALADSLSDDAYSRIVAPGAHVVTLAQGLHSAQGPVWNPRGFWVFSANGALLKITPTGKTAKLHDGPSNGHAYDAQGRLVSCEANLRRVVRKAADGKFEPLTGNFRGQRLQSPQDLALGADGSIYFTDTPQTTVRLSPPGLFRIYPGGRLELLDTKWASPQGIAFSPDHKTLYVSDTGANQVFRYDVDGQGTLANKTLLTTVSKPTGLKVDSQGRVLATGTGGIWIYAPRGGLLGRIPLPGNLTGLAFGGADGKSLLVTAQDAVYSLRLRDQNGAR